ncbi:hypothetical protein LY76DRAFT_206533 [Colletotrichum caudatum]|nr:hypothetical protein LY76DRAFT_206533 [Colletotrichum caudatum]
MLEEGGREEGATDRRICACCLLPLLLLPLTPAPTRHRPYAECRACLHGMVVARREREPIAFSTTTEQTVWQRNHLRSVWEEQSSYLAVNVARHALSVLCYHRVPEGQDHGHGRWADIGCADEQATAGTPHLRRWQRIHQELLPCNTYFAEDQTRRTHSLSHGGLGCGGWDGDQLPSGPEHV